MLQSINGLVDRENNPRIFSTRMLNIKRAPYVLKTVKSSSEREKLLQSGWIQLKKNPKTYSMGLAKPHDRAFEERVWALFARMRFDYLNDGRDFKLEYRPGLRKQIDVFAADREALLIVECKSSLTRKKVNYQKDIDALIGVKERLRASAQDLFEGKQKVAFIFATNNSVIGANDRKRLVESRIFHFTQNNVEYFEQLTDHLESAAKYQLFGKLFEGQKIPELKNRVPAITGKINGHVFYAFCIEPEFLLKTGFIFHRTDISNESFEAYQRLIKRSRLQKIRKFIEQGGYFPNSLIVNIRSRRAPAFHPARHGEHDSGSKIGILHLPKLYRSMFIIDGQHRLYGYARTDRVSDSTIPVVAFYNLPGEEQTQIFVDINAKQKSVPANLLRSIMAEFHWGSDDPNLAMTALKTRLLTNMTNDPDSPFFDRIVLSEEKKTTKRCLTLTSVLTWGLSTKVNFFGKFKGKNQVKIGYLAEQQDEKTLQKASLFFNRCFGFVEKGLKEQWSKGAEVGGFIAMNIGVSAIMRALENLIEHLINSEQLDPTEIGGEELAEKMIPYLQAVVDYVKNLDLPTLKNFRRQFGSGGTGKVLRHFQKSIHNQYEDFAPDGLLQWIKDSEMEFNRKARDLGNDEMQPLIRDYVIRELKRNFGEQYWWSDGVPRPVQQNCAQRQIDQDPRKKPWEFIQLIEYKKIVEKNWELLGDMLTPRGIAGNKDKRLKWLAEFNDIRKKYSHPEREEIVTEDEFNFLAETYAWLKQNLTL